ncbi:hypothetical protein F0L68_10615 [Solihabitans fulvus]|uniref:Uncharacterized protein n=1 Tax=Solihabitans fulvus TaxID=1892852 RepID=A0A5B2XK50_9PSEU|nr:hypothetical protein [Solihabitans fulvus]KAA2263260.1 hypothetical protein F0L68_10615 [Solihabitans fulvus]
MSAETVPELQPMADTVVLRSLPPVAPHTDLDALCERLRPVCAGAVDHFEIAAALEADGLNDSAAHRTYGFPDVFALAGELFRRVPRSPAEPEPQPDPWQTNPARHALRGILFGLPALAYPPAEGIMGGRGAAVVLVVSMLMSWALSQGLSYLGHFRLGQHGRADMARALRAGMAVCLLLLLSLLAVVAAVANDGVRLTLFAAGQGGYLIAATVLLVAGDDLWLLFALLPGVLVGLGYLVLGQPAWLATPALFALAATVLLTIAFAVLRTRSAREAPRRRLTVAELRGCLPHAVFGVLAAGLLAFPVVGVLLTGDPLGAAIAALPLSLSMGAAEWTLYWYRRRLGALLRRTRRLVEFARRSRVVLGGALLRYLVVAAALIVLAVGAVAVLGGKGLRAADLVSCAAYLALGGALFLALLLQACGIFLAVHLACGAALLGEVVLLVGRARFGWPVDVMSAQLCVCGGLGVVLFGYSAAALSRAVRHQ